VQLTYRPLAQQGAQKAAELGVRVFDVVHDILVGKPKPAGAKRVGGAR
jgi:hypothetical protein